MDEQQEAVTRKPSLLENPDFYRAEFVVMVPTWRDISGVTAWSLEKAHLAGLPFAWVPHPGDALIGRARSIMATWFLEKSPASYLIMVDSDIMFNPESLAKLMKDMKDGYELVGGVYTVRGGKFLSHYGDNGKTVLDGTVKPIRYLSTGFMGISKSLLRKMVDKLELPICHEGMSKFRCYPFFENYAYWFDDENKWIYLSEDWDFCNKARKVGVEPHLDTSILLGHQGHKVYTIGDLPESIVTEVAGTENSPALQPKEGENE